MELIIRSKALYSTWIYYKPDRILFDVGEGLSYDLGNKIYGIKKVFFTHSHVDHISGFWGMINTRNNAMGSRDKPLEIYYPKGSRNISEYIEFVRRMNRYIRFEMRVKEITHENIIPLENSRYIKPFITRHTPGEISFGYKIYEIRKRLKEEYKNLSQNQIKELVKEGKKEEILEEYHKCVFLVSGDSLPISLEILKECEVILHECTFLKSSDRKLRNHTSIEEIEEILGEINPKRLILYHISSRYNNMINKVEKRLKEKFPHIDIHFVHPEKLFVL